MPAAGGPARRVTHHPGFDGSAVWLNRGRLTFASRRADANVDIYSVGVDGRGLKRLTRDILDDTAPARSPDGRRIAFVRGLTVSTGQLFVMNADGSQVKRLVSTPAVDAAPAWSPDGKRIVFQSDRDGNPEVYVMNANGSNPHRLTRNPAQDGLPDWQPLR